MTWIETKKLGESKNKIADKVNELSSKFPKTKEKYNKHLNNLNEYTIDEIRKWKEKLIKQIENYLNPPLPTPSKYKVNWYVDGEDGSLSITKYEKKWQVWVSFDKIDDDISLSFSWSRYWGDVNKNGQLTITDTINLNSNNTALNIQHSSVENTISWKYDKNFKLDKWNIHTTLFGNMGIEKSKWEKLQTRTRFGWKISENYWITDSLSWNGSISGSVDKNNDYLKWRTRLVTWFDYSFTNNYSLWTNTYYEKWKSYKDTYYKIYWWWLNLKLNKLKITSNYAKQVDNWWDKVKRSIWLNYDINDSMNVYVKYKNDKQSINWKKDSSDNVQVWFSWKF